MPLAHRLARHGRVYVLDFPGFGRSFKPRRALALPELADVLDEWMDSFAVGSALMVANSFGCEIVAETAVRYPSRLTAAVFLGPTIDRRARNAWSQATRVVATAVREPVGLVRPLLADYLQAGVVRPLQTLRYALDDPLEEKLPRIEVPVLVLRGSEDAIVPQRWAEEVASLLPRGKLRVVPGGAHVLNYDSAAAVEAIVVGWNPLAEDG